MKIEEVIKQLERLIDDREAFIRAYAPDRNVFVLDKEALGEAVKVLKRYNRLMQMKARPVKKHIKIQYEGEELTIKEMVDRLEKFRFLFRFWKEEAEKSTKLVDELMKQHEVTEFCPHCEREITIIWDTETYGYKAYCPVCGGRLMLCSACHDDTNGSCDYNGETDTCRFNQNSTGLDTADEIATKMDGEEDDG